MNNLTDRPNCRFRRDGGLGIQRKGKVSIKLFAVKLVINGVKKTTLSKASDGCRVCAIAEESRRSFMPFAFFFLFAFLGGCSSVAPTHFEINTAPLASEAKIFLVAGSHDNANFAQEIIDQKNIWLSLGYKESEIVCYYAPPVSESIAEDKEQFEKLAPELKRCYPASPIVLRKHFRSVASQHPKFIYLFVTSHGQSPHNPEYLKAIGVSDDDIALANLYRDVKDAQVKPDFLEAKHEWENRMKQYPGVNSYILFTETSPSGRPTYLFQMAGAILHKKVPIDDILLTPSSLADLMNIFPKNTSKYVVLQGCFSGGFIDPAEGERGLRDLSSVTVLTASDANRVSFGCNPKLQATFFGRELNLKLKEQGKAINQMDWAKLFSEVRYSVIKNEEALSLPPSLPQFFTNRSSQKGSLLTK